MQNLFLSTLPVPPPWGTRGGAGAALWGVMANDETLSPQQQRQALSLLHRLALHFMAAVQSIE